MNDKPEIVSVVQRYTKLKKSGNEWLGVCPLHKDRTPSLYVNPHEQCFYCQGCGAGGDVYTFVMRRHGCDFKEAKRILGDDTTKYEPVEIPEKTPDRLTYKPPAGETLKNFDHPYFGKPVKVWVYRDADDSLIHYVCRYERDGKKAYPQWTWDGEKWGIGHYNSPRPLYGLDRLADEPDKDVIICEGEKAADAATILLPDYVAVSWSGGAAAIKKADWKPLMYRNITFWPDCDEAGQKSIEAMRKVFPAIKVLEFAGKSDGWDAADALEEGLTAEDVFRKPEPHYEQELPPDEEPVIASGPEKPFLCIGYDGDCYYYLPLRKKQVIEIKAAGHTLNNLLQLANLSYWQSTYPVSNGNRNIDLNAATSDLFTYCHAAGIYNPDRVRGRGAWLDYDQGGNVRKIIHLGETLLLNGVEASPGSIGGRYIYEAKSYLPIRQAAPASTSQAYKLVEICEALTWETPLSGSLLAGWLVIAAVCGVLKWRSHIWLTGASGSGKSTVLNDIIGRMIGQFALRFDGDTTAPAIRQFMGRDARPVILDEAEAETATAAKRMQSIIELARVSSSGGIVGKGGANNKGVGFSVRSCFCFSSINTSVAHYADESRISKLVLKRDLSDINGEKYDALKLQIATTLTDEFAGAMFARSVEHMTVLEANCDVFTAAAARVFRNRRAADQIGTMLAGLYLCYSSKPISIEKAVEWIEARHWEEHTALQANSDEQRLLATLCSRIIKVSGSTGTKDVSIGEAIVAVEGGIVTPDFFTADAKRILSQMGIRAENGMIMIANESALLAAKLENTPWGKDWKRPLRMMPGASVSPGAIYFSPGLVQRATLIPVSLIKE